MNGESKWLAHMVFFTLHDNSSQAVAALTDACRTHLADHPGQKLFAVGTRTADLDREVNDRDFDVALQVVFDTREAHDDYQVSPRHLQFIEENKANWQNVRVFDADVS